jgi:hypothetical protein
VTRKDEQNICQDQSERQRELPTQWRSMFLKTKTVIGGKNAWRLMEFQDDSNNFPQSFNNPKDFVKCMFIYDKVAEWHPPPSGPADNRQAETRRPIKSIGSQNSLGPVCHPLQSLTA